MICPDHDTIWYAIRCTRYDMFRDTFAILSWEAEACDPGLRSEAPHSTYYNCLRSNDAQRLQQWRPPEFPDAVCLWWIYSCYWNILVVSCGISCSFLTLVCITTVPYRIVSSWERIAICTVASVSAVYWCAGVSFQPYSFDIGWKKMSRTGKPSVYNPVWYQQNQAKIYTQSSKSPKVFMV